MPRLGTLLGVGGKPEDCVQIIRKTKTTTRIKRSTDFGRRWLPNKETVDTALIVDDGGQLWNKHKTSPQHATWIDRDGTPRARIKLQRVYAHVTRARIYIGEKKWSDVEVISSKEILFDGGHLAGWMIPSWETHDKNPTNSDTATEIDAPESVDTKDHSVGQRVAYIRVSTTDQKLARQREIVGPVDYTFSDELSAKSRAGRPGLEACIAYLRKGDELVVASIDRLARSLVDLRGIIDQVIAKGATVHFIKENLTFSTDSHDPRATLMLGILGSFAEFERSIIRERQAEGIALAKKAGKYKGRRKALSPEQINAARQRIKAGESKVAIAQSLGIGRATLYRALQV